MAHKSKVLSLYRQILRTAQSWRALEPQDTKLERQYIKDEAQRLFRKNKGVTDEAVIQLHLKEGHARLELGIHYRIPYPRPTNIPQHVMPITAKKMRKSQRQMERSQPIYLKSMMDEKD